MPTDPARVKRTDPGDPDKCPVWQFHLVYSDEGTRQWVQRGCRSAGIGCLECKQPVIDRVLAEQTPMRERAQKYLDDPTLVRSIVADGCDKARELARETMREVREMMGLNYSYSQPNDARACPKSARSRSRRSGARRSTSCRPTSTFRRTRSRFSSIRSKDRSICCSTSSARRTSMSSISPWRASRRNTSSTSRRCAHRNLDLAAEYLVMAAMLMEIKSRMLLPRPRPADEGEADPRAELVRRLLEYERMKLAAHGLDRLPQRDRDFCAVNVWVEQTAVDRLPQVHRRDLENAWRSLLARARLRRHHKVTRDELSVRGHMSEMLRKLAGGAFRDFLSLFEPWRGIAVLVVNFLALLELAREGLVEVTQARTLCADLCEARGRRLRVRKKDGTNAL